MNARPSKKHAPPGLLFDNGALNETRVFKAGNSLAIRISSSVAKQAGFEDATAVEIVVENGVMYVRKAPSRELTALIDRITPENIHEPIFDEALGAERW